MNGQLHLQNTLIYTRMYQSFQISLKIKITNLILVSTIIAVNDLKVKKRFICTDHEKLGRRFLSKISNLASINPVSCFFPFGVFWIGNSFLQTQIRFRNLSM